MLEASGMEKICCILLVCMFYIMQSVSACQSQGASGRAGPEWDQLVSEGSNYIVRATNTVVVDGRKFQHFASFKRKSRFSRPPLLRISASLR